MSNKRRRAHDFTDSLNSFRQTISTEVSEESIQIISQTPLENRLDHIRNKQDENNSCSRNDKSRESIILAGSLASPLDSNWQYLSSNAWAVSDATSYLPIKPDLNKCINLFHNEHLLKECDSSEEQFNTTSETKTSENMNICHLNKNTAVNRRNLHERSMSAESINNVLCNPVLVRSKSYTTFDRIFKRDTNYNIKDDQLSSPKITINGCHKEIVSSFDALSLSKPLVLPRKHDFYSDQKHNSTRSKKSSKEKLNPSELTTFLHSLTDQNPVKEVTKQQRLLRRLSANYYDCPQNFTERLFTIIEESVVNNDSLQPEISLHRFNEELRKVCKFIEDESVPEWPQSPGISTLTNTRRSQRRNSNETVSWKSFASDSLDKDPYLTPVSPRRHIKSPKKICRRISRNGGIKNLHDSTNTFENLEAYCEQLFPNEYVSTKEKNQLQPSLLNMDDIRNICKNQMDSLMEDSFNIQEEIDKAATCTSDLANRYNKTPEISEKQNLQHTLVSSEKINRTDSKKVSDTFKRQTEYNKCRKLDFESTLLYEIAKNRQKCLEAAKMEIDADLESTKETCSNISESSPTNDAKFMKVLMCVKNYQDCLEKFKPMVTLLYGTRLDGLCTTCDRTNIGAKKISQKKFGACMSSVLTDKLTLRTPKLSPRRKSLSPSPAKHRANKTVVSKSRLFVTPGKTPINRNCKPKRTYFPNLLPGLNKQEDSSNKKRIYRQMGNYDHVISPVAMYIKGTESMKKTDKLLTDELLLTPERKQTMPPPHPKVKFRLSPITNMKETKNQKM